MQQNTIDVIVKHYLACALWASTGDDDEPLGDKYTEEDFSESVKQQARVDVESLLTSLERDGIDWRQYWTPEQFGHDFWLTRNHHGAGFWCRYGWSHGDAYLMGVVLTEQANAFPQVDLYVGDDGLIHAQ